MVCVFFLLSVATVSLLRLSEGSYQCLPIFDNEGDISITGSLVQCATHMSDPLQPITHVQKYLDMGVTLTVESRFEFNNLVSVNELENTVTVDFFYRLWWQDIRWNLTEEFWAEVPVSVFYDGIELHALTFDTDEVLPYWRPDLHFIDVKEVETFAVLVKLRPGI